MKYIFGKCFPSVLLASLIILVGAQKPSNHQKDTDPHTTTAAPPRANGKPPRHHPAAAAPPPHAGPKPELYLQRMRGLDIHELARQNKITQQILQYYLHKRLGLARGNDRPPSIDDILPIPKVEENGSGAGSNVEEANYEHIAPDDENLQSVESEQVNRIYSEGRKKYVGTVGSPYEADESYQCTNCEDDGGLGVTRWTMPLLKLGEKKYYLGIFFKANWYKAQQYCRFHGMHLSSISSQEENDKLEKYVRDSGFGNEHFWTSGTDLAEEGSFFWMANGRPLTFVNWNAGEPNNFRYENGEEENCLELWNRDGKGLKWNDSPCSFETFFICEVRSD